LRFIDILFFVLIVFWNKIPLIWVVAID